MPCSWATDSVVELTTNKYYAPTSPCDLFLSVSQTMFCMHFLISAVPATCPAHLIYDLITLIIPVRSRNYETPRVRLFVHSPVTVYLGSCSLYKDQLVDAF